MIKEIAVDPGALECVLKLQLISNSLGIEKARLLSKFPTNWQDLIYNNFTNSSDMEKKKAELLLIQISNCMIDKKRIYNANNDWLNNALRSDKTSPFHAIVVNDQNINNGKIMSIDGVDETNVHWKVRTTVRLTLSYKKILYLLDNLFFYSNEVTFVDPYINPTMKKYRAFCNTEIKHFSSKSNIKYITFICASVSGFNDTAIKSNKCFETFQKSLPPSQTVYFKQLNCKYNEHNRYVITNKGVAFFGNSFNAFYGGKRKDDVSMLNIEHHQELYKKFCSPSCCAKFNNIYTITNNSIS
jgi:hypothetical protein